MSGLIDVADRLPNPLSIAVVTDLTIPVLLAEEVGLMVLSVFRRPTQHHAWLAVESRRTRAYVSPSSSDRTVCSPRVPLFTG